MSNYNSHYSCNNHDNQQNEILPHDQHCNWSQNTKKFPASDVFLDSHRHSYNIPAQNQFCKPFNQQRNPQPQNITLNRDPTLPSYQYDHHVSAPSTSFHHGPKMDAYNFPPPNFPPPNFPPPIVNSSQNFGNQGASNYSSLQNTDSTCSMPPKDSYISSGNNYEMPPKDSVLAYGNNYEKKEIIYEEPNQKDQMSDEKTWLHNWEKKLEIKKYNSQPSHLKISDVQGKLLDYIYLIEELESLQQNMMQPENASETYQQKSCRECENIKLKIESIKKFFNGENTKLIKNMVERRRKKRARSKIVKKQRNMERSKIKGEWMEKKMEIDAWSRKLNEQHMAKIHEEKLKKEADSILHEVSTKQDEALKMQKLIDTLRKLRDTRVKKGDVHGYITSEKSNMYFERVTDKLKNLVDSQLKEYHLEEQTLKVMMEESPNVLSIASKKSSNESLNLEKYKKQIYEILFGEKIPPDKQDEYQRSFTANEESIEILIKRRAEWDQFIVEENSSLSSTVPLGWVVPNTDPLPVWKTFQLKNA